MIKNYFNISYSFCSWPSFWSPGSSLSRSLTHIPTLLLRENLRPMPMRITSPTATTLHITLDTTIPTSIMAGKDEVLIANL